MWEPQNSCALTIFYYFFWHISNLYFLIFFLFFLRIFWRTFSYLKSWMRKKISNHKVCFLSKKPLNLKKKINLRIIK